jgi:rRNA maturation RNase YbeY
MIKNSQRSIAVDLNQIQQDVEQILHFLKYDGYELGIWFTTNRTIREYNKIYRGKDKPTDILSFSYHEHLKPGERIKIKNPDDANLGDLIISVEYVQKAAEAFGLQVQDHLRVLLVHGICHLLGYDHEKDEDYEIMHREEKRILNRLKKTVTH